MAILNQVNLLPISFHFFSSSSVMLHCCKVKGLPSRYLFFAESGTCSIAAYLKFFFPSRSSDFGLQLGDEFC
jgi:hypothetical protein